MSSRLLKTLVSAQAVKPTRFIIATTTVRPTAAAATFAFQQPLSRFYAKKTKDNKKKNVQSKAAVVSDEAEEFERQFNEKQIQERYEHSISQLKEHLANMRMGRANPCKMLVFCTEKTC
jgi:DNA-binding transcriptional regulator GbsR (MarR family)